MQEFNKWAFLSDLKDSLLNEIKNGYLTDTDQIHEFISYDLDNAVIYYADCFAIAAALNLTSFTGYELGDATDICQLAYFGLYEFINEEFNYSEIEAAIEAKQEAETE